MSENALPSSSANLGNPAAGARHRLDWERFGLIYVLLALIIGFSLFVPGFFRLSTLQIVLGSQATQIVVALAVAVALIGGEFDLSVANVVAVTGSATAYLNAVQGWPISLTLVVVIAGAVAFGALNAFLVVRVGVDSIIVTLGTGTLVYGACNGWAGTAPRGGIDQGFVQLATFPVFGLPLAIYITFLVGLALYYVLEHTPLGRRFVFAGRNLEVARLAGIRVNNLRAGSLIFSAFLAAIAGILLVGITGAAVPSVASGYLLPAFAGAFLGSTVFHPGRFNVPGVFVAIYFLVAGVSGLQLLGYTGWVNDLFYGATLVVAVVATKLLSKKPYHAGGHGR